MTDMPTNPSPSFRLTPDSTIGDALRSAPLDALDARILLGHALQLSRVQLITQSQRVLSADEITLVSDLFQRRINGEPIAYIVGEREFYGLMLYTTPDVLIPRPETELLVDLALERITDGASVLDLGTGSGAIAVALAYSVPDAMVTATDNSAAALAIAQRNAARHGADVTFLQGDWYAPVSGRQFNLIVSNPPYIVAGDPHLSQGDLRFEPISALTDHADGLSALRTIIDGARSCLAPGGWLLMEHGYDQAPAVRSLLARHGFQEVQSWKDLAGIERVTGARL